MSELTVSAAHEARHAAVGMLTGIPVEHVLIHADGTGECKQRSVDMDAEGGRNLIRYTLAGYMGEDDWPPSWPDEQGSTKDEQDLAKLVKSLDLSRDEWRSLVADTDELLDSPACTALTGAIALLLRKHGAVDESQLQRLLAATKTKDDDMDERPTHGPDGIIEDWVIDEALANTRANAAQPSILTSSNGDEPESFEDTKQKAYAQILRVLTLTTKDLVN